METNIIKIVYFVNSLQASVNQANVVEFLHLFFDNPQPFSPSIRFRLYLPTSCIKIGLTISKSNAMTMGIDLEGTGWSVELIGRGRDGAGRPGGLPC